MKILHVIVDLDVGGAELILKRLVEDQNQRFSTEHLIISLTDIGTVGQHMKQAGFNVTALGMKGLKELFSVLTRLTRIIRQYQPDIVQTWMYHSDLIGGLAARLAGVKQVVWGIRSTDISQGGSKSTLLIRKLCAWLSCWLPQKIVCAANVSRDIHISVGYSAKKMLVIPNGFDLKQLVATSSQRDALRAELGIHPNDRVVGSVGRYSPVKDHAVFVEAAGRLLTKDTLLKFMLIGRGVETQNTELMTLINATRFPQAFFLLGERADVAACLKSMDFFCLHSRTEGFPNALGEAMALGLPCVTTDVGDAAFLLGKNGLVVPSKDAIALADALDLILARQPSELIAMGAAAQARIQTEFSMQMMTHRFNQLYAELLLGKR